MMRERTQAALGCFVAVIVALLLVVGATGCATTGIGGKKFDSCQALNIAAGSHAIAGNASEIVCVMLKGDAREKCLKHRQQIKSAASAILNLAGTAVEIFKACKL